MSTGNNSSMSRPVKFNITGYKEPKSKAGFSKECKPTWLHTSDFDVQYCILTLELERYHCPNASTSEFLLSGIQKAKTD